jgi:hypothetical protein
MKKFFTFMVMAVFAMSTMMANWQPSDIDATKLDKEGANGQVQMKTLRTDDGKIVLTWLRGERVSNVFSYQLHLQLFDANGNAQFGDEGIIVCDKRTRTWTTDYGLALASNGDILLAYTDIRNDPNEENAETYLYRYSQQGEPVWDADGILFPSGKIHENALSVEDVAPAICVSGNNIFVAANHSEYYMEEANEDNWSPSPWFPNQQMPDSVLVNNSEWLIVVMDNDGMMRAEAPMSLDSKIVTMNPAPNGNIYLLYNNQELGLDAQLLTHELNNQWDDPVTVEDRPLSSGMFMPTPLTALADDDVLFISYRVLTDFYGFQVVNSLNPNGATAPEGVSLTGHFDGDAGTAQMGVKQDRAFVAWEYAYSASEKYMNVNVVDNNNNYFWTDEAMYGLYLDISFDWGFTPVKVIPVSDGWVVLYGISTSWNGATFMVEKLDELGNTVWAKQICEDDFKSSGFSITYDENYAYIFYTQEEEYDDNWDVIPGSGGMYVMCVDIKGDHTAINEVPTGEGIVSTEIYTIDGRRVNQLEKGINIVRTTDANGNVTTTKVLN